VTDAPLRQPDAPVAGDDTLDVSLEMFEGPLDLLLHLVRRHELDILDIPIAFVTEKYLEYLQFMRALDLEVAGEYLVMAATLAYIKSRELLPRELEADEEQGDEEDGPDPRELLIAQLLEYQKFKAAAESLDRMPIAGRDVFARGQPVDLPPVDPGLAPITLFRLAEAYERVLSKAKIVQQHEVVLETVSVAQRMEQLTLLLERQPRVEFEELFLGRTWSSVEELRGMLVVTLMSLLELVKLGIVAVHQPDGSDAIAIERRADAETARRAMAGYDEEASFGDVRRAAPAPADDADDELDGELPPADDAGDELDGELPSADDAGDELDGDLPLPGAEHAGEQPAAVSHGGEGEHLHGTPRDPATVPEPGGAGAPHASAPDAPEHERHAESDDDGRDRD